MSGPWETPSLQHRRSSESDECPSLLCGLIRAGRRGNRRRKRREAPRRIASGSQRTGCRCTRGRRRRFLRQLQKGGPSDGVFAVAENTHEREKCSIGRLLQDSFDLVRVGACDARLGELVLSRGVRPGGGASCMRTPPAARIRSADTGTARSPGPGVHRRASAGASPRGLGRAIRGGAGNPRRAFARLGKTPCVRTRRVLGAGVNAARRRRNTSGSSTGSLTPPRRGQARRSR
jgi:hypothetical protein